MENGIVNEEKFNFEQALKDYANRTALGVAVVVTEQDIKLFQELYERGFKVGTDEFKKYINEAIEEVKRDKAQKREKDPEGYQKALDTYKNEIYRLAKDAFRISVLTGKSTMRNSARY